MSNGWSTTSWSRKSERKYVVPNKMRVAVARTVFDECGKCDFHPQIRVALEAACRWLSENPIVPSETDAIILADVSLRAGDDRNKQVEDVATEWQRRMFLAPDTIDDREMIVYECHNCKKSWKQQLREKVTSCVYCQSTNTESIATVSAVRDYPIAPDQSFRERTNLLLIHGGRVQITKIGSVISQLR